MRYYFQKTTDQNFETAEAKVREALQNHGFGILTEIDLKNTFKNKLDKDIRPHKILGACNPNFAFQAVSEEPQISTLLPCNVTLAEKEDGKIEITMMDPEAAFSLVDNEQVAPLAKEVKAILEQALAEVS